MSYPTEINRIYLKERYHNQRQEFLNYLGGCCVICGATENLQFDHIIAEKKSFPISKLWAIKDLNIAYKELDKCQILCANHHLEKTLSDSYLIELRKEAKHGTISRYKHHKCRCDDCIKAHRLYKKKYRLETGLTKGIREQYNLPSPCGTIKSYHRGCRCGLCRKANTDYKRIQRKIKSVFE